MHPDQFQSCYCYVADVVDDDEGGLLECIYGSGLTIDVLPLLELMERTSFLLLFICAAVHAGANYFCAERCVF